MNKEKIEDKLEEIINKYQIHTSIGIKETIDVCDEWDMKTMGVAINELSTLIQEERKEAVEGFVDNIGWKKPSEVIDLADDVIDGRSLVKQMEAYLQSLESETK